MCGGYPWNLLFVVHWRRGNFVRRIEKDLLYFETDWVLGRKNIGEQLPNHVQGDNLRLKWTFCDKATFLVIRSYYPLPWYLCHLLERY